VHLVRGNGGSILAIFVIGESLFRAGTVYRLAIYVNDGVSPLSSVQYMLVPKEEGTMTITDAPGWWISHSVAKFVIVTSPIELVLKLNHNTVQCDCDSVLSKGSHIYAFLHLTRRRDTCSKTAMKNRPTVT
jgi:hypothetical protein